MSNESQAKLVQTKASLALKQKLTDNNKKAATHFHAVKKHNIDTFKHHEADNHHKAATTLMLANGYQISAKEIQKKEFTNHAQKATNKM